MKPSPRSTGFALVLPVVGRAHDVRLCLLVSLALHYGQLRRSE
jgi:hypothetical protein